MATIKSEYYRFNGTAWDLHYFKTSADLLVETATYKVLTATERTTINDYLTTFNAANKLVKLDGTSKVPVGLIPALSYLPLSGGLVNGDVGINGTTVMHGDLYINNGVLTTDNAGGITYKGEWFDFDGARLRNLDTPSLGTDAATKEYVDNLVSAGFKVKDPVKAASTANVNIAVALNSLDGYTLSANDRVLLKNQTTTSQNGVYQLNASKIPVKVDADSTLGNAVFVENGDTNNDYIYTNSVIDTWRVFARPDTIKPGNGLNKVGTTLNIADLGVTNAMIAGAIDHTKIAGFKSEEKYDLSVLWDPKETQSLNGHLSNIYSIVRIIRGTANYNTVNTQTIAGAYTLANTKIKSEIGTAVPGTSGYTNGDLFFRTIG